MRSTGLRLVYVMSAGRSGSTVLDTVLGNHPQIESVGELASLHRAYARDEFCACRRRTPECPFWSEVWARWREVVGERALAAYPVLQARFERLRRLPLLLAPGPPSAALAAYRATTLALLESIARVAGKTTVVDSSKSPARAVALAGAPGLELALIHLVRDCRGVAFSRTKSFERAPEEGLENAVRPVSVGNTAWSWLAFNLVAGLVRRHAGARATLLRYEDVVATPGPALDRLGGFLGLDFGDLTRCLGAGSELAVGHTVSGNRVRMRGSLSLVPDLTWTRELPDEERRKVWRRCGGLLRRYGYSR